MIAPARHLERLLQISLGGHQMAGIGERAREICERGGGAVVVDGLLFPPDVDGLLEQRNRALAQSLAAVGNSDALQELRPHFGLQILAADLCRAAIQQLFGGRIAPLRR